MEGPQFSTLAEAHVHRQLRFEVIGMTNVTEAKLAREAELCYATLAMITDYDCWHPAAQLGDRRRNHRQSEPQCGKRAECFARRRAAMPAERTCRCGKSLAHAIITDPALHPGGSTAALVARSLGNILPRGLLMSLLVVGSVAFDALETPYGKVDRTLGGAATYFSIAASCFTHVNLVGVVGDDFTEQGSRRF